MVFKTQRYISIDIIGSIISFSSILQWPYAILKLNSWKVNLKLNICIYLPIMLLFFFYLLLDVWKLE